MAKQQAENGSIPSQFFNAVNLLSQDQPVFVPIKMTLVVNWVLLVVVCIESSKYIFDTNDIYGEFSPQISPK